ncbi:MAG: hypothetical protein GY950_22505, partial [bacterium]|nr:hypothetical protein [bacterium]
LSNWPFKAIARLRRVSMNGWAFSFVTADWLAQRPCAMMGVARLMVIMAIFMWYGMDKGIKKVEANPMMVVNQEAVSQNRLAIGVTFFLAAVFFGLFFWAKTNPFGAALTAFIIYITNIIVTIGIDPKSILQGIYVKAAIIVVLANGIKSGLTYKKAKESQQQLHHETLDRETMDTQHPHSTNE